MTGNVASVTLVLKPSSNYSAGDTLVGTLTGITPLTSADSIDYVGTSPLFSRLATDGSISVRLGASVSTASQLTFHYVVIISN